MNILIVDLLHPRIVLTLKSDLHWESFIEIHLYTNPCIGIEAQFSFQTFTMKLAKRIPNMAERRITPKVNRQAREPYPHGGHRDGRWGGVERRGPELQRQTRPAPETRPRTVDVIFVLCRGKNHYEEPFYTRESMRFVFEEWSPFWRNPRMQILQARPEAVEPAKQSIRSKETFTNHRFLRYRDHWIWSFTDHRRKARIAALTDRIFEGGQRGYQQNNRGRVYRCY